MVYTDVDTWCVQASSKHWSVLHSKKFLVEKVIQYVKSRT